MRPSGHSGARSGASGACRGCRVAGLGTSAAAEGTPMFHFSHARHRGDAWRRMVLATPVVVAAAFLCFLLIMVLGRRHAWIRSESLKLLSLRRCGGSFGYLRGLS